MKLHYLLVFLFLSFAGFGQEICDNGIDDDADGRIDLNDSDCLCGSTTSVPSIIPNPSFESYANCPTSFSQLNQSTSWIQATTATTDYYNTCGYVVPAVAASALSPFPHGNGIVGALYLRDWNEYLGTTLSSPMVMGQNYQMTFSIGSVSLYGDGTTGTSPVSIYEPVNVTLYGCANGSNLPLDITSDPNTADPTWIELGSATYTPVSGWGEITMTFTPAFNVNAIMLGPPKVLPPTYPISNSGELPYIVYDRLLLNLASAFGVNIAQTGFFCYNNLVLEANVTAATQGALTYQWYRNGIAIVGATSSTYAVSGNPANLGEYCVRVTNGNTCYISSKLTVNNTVPAPEVTSVQPTCIELTGSITITSPADQYSFDNGATWQTSPTKTGLPIGNYFVKTKTVSGCISATTGVGIVEPQMLTGGGISTIQPQVCGGTGTITVTSTIATEYSFDNGVTWTTSNTASGLLPGSHLIRVKDAEGCQSGAQEVYLYEIFSDAPTSTWSYLTCSPSGSITITSPGIQFSFDGGLTWGTSNIATNLPEGAYTIQTINAQGCKSYPSYVYLYPQLPPAPTLSATQPTCENLGNIVVTTVAAEYSFDGGTTWQTSNELTGLSAGYYEIRTRDANGCVSDHIFVYLQQSYLMAPTFTVTHPFCTETTGTIAITPEANYSYSFDGGMTYQASNVSGPLSPGPYVIKVRSVLGCESDILYLYINDPSGIPPVPTGSANQLFCIFNNPTVADLTAQGSNLLWYASAAATTALSPDTPLVDGMTYYATQTGSNNCESQIRLAVTVSVIAYDLPAFDFGTLVCDDLNDGSQRVDLSDYLSSVTTDPSLYQFSYYTTFDGADTASSAQQITNFANYDLGIGLETIYIRISAPNGCWKVAVLKLDLIPSPFNDMRTSYILCENSVAILRAEQGFDGYLWSTGQTGHTIVVSQAGNYWVTVSENHGGIVCTTTTDMTVTLSNPATILDIETVDWTDDNNTITVYLSDSSIGDYEYSLDGEHYQSSNTFTGLAPGIYTVYVRDRNECGIVDQDVFLLTYPRFFTPNGDSSNDFWHVKFARYEKALDVKIFDRHGKFITQLLGDGAGWDGTMNGHALPSSDYWFTVTRADGKEFKGHFAMKR
ncbi:T9SS type B sorting domain-containing protein [Flavobacterium selenitireducens]|uniref:T9SS type B sorting domain-containing protein n=1 Tax=Flavobacterium selenitireducens TaxID=2722704 RepID=UPI00168A5CDF|nr:T9SS type B sorting domain-containing protein [Flavobacterium selenitireducens]MBD3582575.1 T9SS type B sorting domain-containing protein [Flavobacterium selenitireducens]